MQLRFLSVLFLFFIGLVSAAAIASPARQESSSSWLITFPDAAPDSFISKSINHLKKIGGKVTHEFTFIKSFAFTAPVSIVNQFNKLDCQAEAQDAWKPTIEKDSVVKANTGGVQ
ncbi:hypothetical protein ABW20_dc0106461 [Dactylellina cionopaga]|nr:hypothetical protein ABW20_dc0106461 [Dactylellina cionopaga]